MTGAEILKMDYGLATFVTGYVDLFKIEDEVLVILAYQFREVWMSCPKDHPRTSISRNRVYVSREITEEEAAMILFQCEESI